MQAGSPGDQSAQAEAFLMSTHNIFYAFMKNWRKKSHNYHQKLLNL